MRRRLWLAGMLVCCAGSARADVLTQHDDNARTGVNRTETTLTTKNVKPDTFGKLWTVYADGQVVAQPLYVAGLNVATPQVQGKFNALIVATMHNTVYAYDADKENRLPDGKTKPLWATWLGQPRPGGKDIDMWSTNDPDWGILSTPVIDPEKSTLWVVAWHAEAGKFRYRLHALGLRDGSALKPSVIIGGNPPDAGKPCNYPGGFNPCKQKQRAALLLDRGVIYAAFGGDGSKGCLFAFDAASLQQVGFWSVTPNGKDGGIWQSGQGPAADADGSVYLMTGNGTLGADNYGESFVRLKLENGALTVKDFFAPCNKDFLNQLDMDLGSGGPVLIPNTPWLFGGGKEGVMYVLKKADLGKHVSAGAVKNCQSQNVVQQFQATDLHDHGAGTMFGHIHGSPVFWRAPDVARMYVWGENNRLKAFTFKNGKFDAEHPQLSIYQPPDGMPGGMLSLSSNADKVGSAVLWGVVPSNGDVNTSRGVHGVVVAVDARDVTRQLWTSDLAGVRDRLGLYAKYVPPTIGGGKLFVATYGDNEPLKKYGWNERPAAQPAKYYVAVYGVLGKPPAPKPIVNQDSADTTVTKASAVTALTLDTQTCLAADGGEVDCTAALEKKFGAPSLHTLRVPRGYDFAGCQLLRVTTASKRAALEDATGMGWYAAEATAGSQAMTTGRFVRSGAFKQVGAATLKSQEPALLHEFIGVANCNAGQGSVDRLFKPYLQFENAADGKIYRNWDLANDYRISRALPQFDRSADVLAP